jgi:hypothetical protein
MQVRIAQPGRSRSVAAPETHQRAILPPGGLRVPEFDALNDTAIPGQVDDPRLTARRDPLANRDVFRGRVAEVNHHADELDGALLRADLNRAVLALRLGNGDAVVAHRSVHMGFAQILPSALGRRPGRGEQRQSCKY